jgi:hypothetical protein
VHVLQHLIARLILSLARALSLARSLSLILSLARALSLVFVARRVADRNFNGVSPDRVSE